MPDRPHQRVTAAVGLVLLAWSGCAAKIERPQRTIAVQAPERWTAAPESNLPTEPDWWAYFGDAGLDGAIRRTLTFNKDLTAAAARLDAALAQSRIAGAAGLPELSASLSRNRQRNNFIGLPIPGAEGRVLSTTNTTLGLGLNLSWEPDLWGRVRSGKLAALADLQATQSDLSGARLSLTGQTAKAWFTAIEAKRQLQLAQASLESFGLSAERIRARFESGTRPSLDLRLALTAVERAESTLRRRRRVLDAAIRQLEVLMGQYPNAEYELGEDLPEAPKGVPSGLPAELVHRRPDLISAERRLLAADARIAQSQAALRPSFSLTGSNGTTTNRLQDMLSADVFVWSLFSGITQPLFNHGRLKAGVQQSEAVAAEAAAGFENAILTAYREVETALAADSFLAEEEKFLESATRQALAAQELAESRYRLGLADIVTLLDSQRTAIDSESQWLAIRRARLDNRVDLHLALGGGFSMSFPEPAQPVGGDRERL